MPKVHYNSSTGRLEFYCPGCHEAHAVSIHPSGWSWDENPTTPTIAPSIKVSSLKLLKDENYRWTGGWVRDAQGKTIPTLCHSYISEGEIQFLADCTHALANQTVPLPAWPGTAL